MSGQSQTTTSLNNPPSVDATGQVGRQRSQARSVHGVVGILPRGRWERNATVRPSRKRERRFLKTVAHASGSDAISIGRLPAPARTRYIRAGGLFIAGGFA